MVYCEALNRIYHPDVFGVEEECDKIFLQYVWKFSGSPRFDYLYANKDVELGPSNDILKGSGVTVMRN